jgi:GTPase SAR1 family protein
VSCYAVNAALRWIPPNKSKYPWWGNRLNIRNDANQMPSLDRATEMDITMIGLQNAGKTSLLRVLAVRLPFISLDTLVVPHANS